MEAFAHAVKLFPKGVLGVPKKQWRFKALLSKEKVMISSRMLRIIQYMQLHPKTSYREVAEALQVKERSIRYDIDRINDILSMEHLPGIKKESKGQLVFPESIPLEAITGSDEFLYSGEERMALLLLTLLIRKEDFQINRMSRVLQVSRSTVKTDVNELAQKLESQGLSIEYTDHFELVGPKQSRVVLLNDEFKKYISLLVNSPRKLNTFDAECIRIIHCAFGDISIPQIILCVDELLKANAITLTDDSYKWYLSNVIVLCWFIINHREYPLVSDVVPAKGGVNYGNFFAKLSKIMGCQISEKNQCFMQRFLNCTSHFSHFNSEVDLIDAEAIVYGLINAVSNALDTPFEHDSVLVEGLLNHIIPLMNRLQNKMPLWDENIISVLSQKDLPLFHTVKEICDGLPILKEIKSEDEIVYLAIYFLASIKRMFGMPHKRILLVCGHGYGTTTMLREALLGEYQIYIVDTIPLYKVSEYPGWNGVDCVLSTTRIDSRLPRPTIMVNPILKPEDYSAIEAIGISRKHNLTSYYAIEQNLAFLKAEDKKRVMDVIEKELGYRTVSQYKTPKEFSSLLKYDCIQIIDQKMDWEEAVHTASAPLIDRGFIETDYVQDMITTMKSIGFYAISDGSFALLHGKEKVGVNKTSISLVINRQPVTFGDKKAKIIFCLAPENAKAHIPAIITLMRMVKKTSIIQDLENAKTIEEIYETILRYEFEVA